MDANEKVRDLFKNTEFQERLREDEASFMRAVEKITGPFLKVGADADKDINEFFEPVAFVAVQYNRDMRLADAAYELGIEPEQLKSQGNNRALLQLGLKPLFDGEAIKRSMWAAIDDNFSPFQITLREMSLGIGIAVENVEKEFDLIDQDE